MNWPAGDPATTSRVAVYSQRATYVLSSLTKFKICHQPNEIPGEEDDIDPALEEWNLSMEEIFACQIPIT